MIIEPARNIIISTLCFSSSLHLVTIVLILSSIHNPRRKYTGLQMQEQTSYPRNNDPQFVFANGTRNVDFRERKYL